jgi:hypothetical protein
MQLVCSGTKKRFSVLPRKEIRNECVAHLSLIWQIRADRHGLLADRRLSHHCMYALHVCTYVHGHP